MGQLYKVGCTTHSYKSTTSFTIQPVYMIICTNFIPTVIFFLASTAISPSPVVPPPRSPLLAFLHPTRRNSPLRVEELTASHLNCLPSSLISSLTTTHLQHRIAAVGKSDSISNPKGDSSPKSKPKRKGRQKKTRGTEAEPDSTSNIPPLTIPRKPRRGRRSEAVAVEDFVRDSLEKTFASIREQNPDAFVNKEQILKEGNGDTLSDVSSDDDDGQEDEEMVVNEDDPTWPVDADVGWGTRASTYFENYPIKSIVGDDGIDIDWEGEIDNSWVQEINCLEWESFAFHPSPLIVLVFERYNRATDNWKLLKELEKALKVYWNAKDRLPPRAVKLDINIEKDLAYALKVRQCPQILFLRGNKILYRESEMRTSDELVQMIACFYYKAKKPSWVDEAALAS